MNITFVFGNGFDIQVGLCSRYDQFLKTYINFHETDSEDSENIKIFKNYLKDSKNQELWSDAEKAMGVHLEQFSDDTLSDYTERIFDFESHMIEYLEEEQKRCSFTRSGEIKAVFLDFIRNSFEDILTKRRNDFSKDCFDKCNITYNFITFNYTNLLEKILECCDRVLRSRKVDNINFTEQIGEICHIHGSLDTQVIMGVNDESQLKVNREIAISEQLKGQTIKPVMNLECEHLGDVHAQRIIDESNVILIYGVSFGDTDKIWWDRICEWLRDDTNHRLVVFIKDTGVNLNKKIPWSESNYEKINRKRLLRKLGFDFNSKEFSVILEQTYIILNTTRLNLKEIVINSPIDDEAVLDWSTLEKIFAKH